MDAGRYAAAARQLADMAPRTRDPLEQAVQWRMLGTAQFGLGRLGDCLASAEHAVAMADTHSSRRELLFARQLQARAWAANGQTTAAVLQLTAVQSGLVELGYADTSTERLRVRRLLAEALLRDGQVVAARSQLAALLQTLASAAWAHPIEHAEALELAGLAAARAGQASSALQLHEAARLRLSQSLPDLHPLLRRNTLYMAAARQLADPSDARHAELARAARSFQSDLVVGSAWTTPARAAQLDPPAPMPPVL